MMSINIYFIFIMKMIQGRFGVGVNKSAGLVHGKWGATSFTSLRTVNGIGSRTDCSTSQQQSTTIDSGVGVAKKRDWDAIEKSYPASNISAPRPNKFFKSRDTTTQSQSSVSQTNLAKSTDNNLHSTTKSIESNGKSNRILKCIKILVLS